jgi:transcriptional regulator with XRE-family HTH domain
VSEDAPEDWVAVGNAIRRRRTAQKMTQRELGKISGVGETTIRELEQHVIRNRVVGTLERISQAFDLPSAHFDDVLAGRIDDEAVRPASLTQVIDKLNQLDNRLSAIEAKQADILHRLTSNPDVLLDRSHERHLQQEVAAPEQSRPKTDSETA